ncbi:BZ3500_MvSof-1268-A1-R1_Chr5-2g07743 [Microbotryum saponariae]|uniref:Protein BTN n=1 Tax=Microbotryum saponariae TaxID=289078 RepID=A0A2X0MDN3_9BASI|nr:BZ3500_MvSof-1268-A1-R1_Chr5-2g07743 [Microbotryum saponariae]SDA05612.1 BZ3501_MvSof-1269-A2-R1_Chr5-2g07565 [Microbotryum saponariae]
MPRSLSSSSSAAATAAATATPIPHRLRFGASFFCFGLLNNVLYVVILSAALDLVDKATTPKVRPYGQVAPARPPGLEMGFGQARYDRRILSCSAISFVGIIIVASSSTLFLRLFGIAIASFSSGLGEMTYLQLTTLYGSLRLPASIDLGGFAVGWFSSGTGAAGLVGAGLWWVLRGLGVKGGLLICSFLPLCMALTFYFLLPRVETFGSAPFDVYTFVVDEDDLDQEDDVEGEREEEDSQVGEALIQPQAQRPAEEGEEITLTTREKLALAKPLFKRYMLPLFFVYLAEYTINSGIFPTLIYEVPSPSTPILSSLIHSLRDYYPLWQLVYQFWVFVSRSSLSILHLPPLPIALLPLPTIFQLFLLTLTFLESSRGIFLNSSLGENGTIVIVFCLVSCEGLAGGSAYVNCFYRLGREEETDDREGKGDGSGGEEVRAVNRFKSSERKKLEREFRIASVGFADTLGILMASLVATGLEPWLVRQQVARGRTLCLNL